MLKEKGIFHNNISLENPKIGRKGISLLIPDGICDYLSLAESFKAESAEIDPEISELVTKVLSDVASKKYDFF